MSELFEYLIKNNVTVATAESCTGGNIAAEFVAREGISSVFLLGAVTYANSAKMRILRVREQTLKKHGAVSFECALEMLKGVQKASGADAVVCTTGIAGPGGATNDKPVGLVFVGVRYKNKSKVCKCFFTGNREEVISKATKKALQLLEKTVKN